ncbi:MAG: YceI family protein [Burkholderiales bacterium]|nr:YceI family protein [Burkholderiales bacterium]
MNASRSVAAALFLLAILPHAFAQRVSAIDAARSEVRFSGKQMGVSADGRFGRIAAQIEFDAAKPAAGRVRVEVDLNSVDIGATEVNTEVKRKPWFHVAAFPTAIFESTALRAMGGARYEADGRISIKGHSRDVVVPFTVRQQGRDVVFEGSFTLLRLQFGVGDGVWKDTDTVSNEVQVRFKLVGAAVK